MRTRIHTVFLSTIIIGLLSGVSLTTGISLSSASISKSAQEEKQELAPLATAALLMEFDTGKVIYEKNQNRKLSPASVTKVMTMLLALEAVEAGRVRLDTAIKTSEYAAAMGGSQMYLEPGNVYTLDEMLKAIALQSANDASIAVAEHLAGSEQAFVARMNERSLELGMTSTHFVNPHGLAEPEEESRHFSTAADIARMSRELLRHEQVLQYTGLREYMLMQNNGKPFAMRNSNALLGEYEGLDGLKTGFTFAAMHCLVATAKRDGMRLIAIAMGEPDKPSRSREVTAMLDYGFKNYRVQTVVPKGRTLGTLPVFKGSVNELVIHAQQDYSVIENQADSARQYTYEIKLPDQLPAPIRAGDKVGELRIFERGQLIETHELAAELNVERTDFWRVLGDVYRVMFFLK